MKVLDIFKRDKKHVPSIHVVEFNDKSNVIETIHKEFFTEVDRLLSEAGIVRETAIKKDNTKAKRLSDLGFVSSPLVKDYLDNTNTIDASNQLIDAINYFSVKYPNYKFITEESVRNICKKYGLIYGAISKYKGDVPDVNLRHIEEFKIKDEDMCYEYTNRYMMVKNICGYDMINNYRELAINKEICVNGIEKKEIRDKYSTCMDFDMISFRKSSLEIVAPVGDFDTKNMQIDGYKLREDIKDPILLCPVYYKNNKYYLIVTAWGLESGDVDVINEVMN